MYDWPFPHLPLLSRSVSPVARNVTRSTRKLYERAAAAAAAAGWPKNKKVKIILWLISLANFALHYFAKFACARIIRSRRGKRRDRFFSTRKSLENAESILCARALSSLYTTRSGDYFRKISILNRDVSSRQLSRQTRLKKKI